MICPVVAIAIMNLVMVSSNFIRFLASIIDVFAVTVAFISVGAFVDGAQSDAVAKMPTGKGLDPRFGHNGVQRMPSISPDLKTRVTQCISLSNGDILALATAEKRLKSYRSTIPRSDFIAKYSKRGALALQFADRGLFLGPSRKKYAFESLSADESDRPILILRRTLGVKRGRLTLVRLTKNGRLDRTFGSRHKGKARLRGKIGFYGGANAFPLADGRILVTLENRNKPTQLVVLRQNGIADRRFSGDGRTEVALRDVVVAGLPDGEIAVAGTTGPEPGSKVQVIRLRRNGSQRLDWAQAGVHEIVGIPAEALPPGMSATDVADIVGSLRDQKVILMTVRPNGGLLLGITSSDWDNVYSSIEWLRRLNVKGDLDVAFGVNGSAFGQFETMTEGEETQVYLSQLLPTSRGRTIALNIDNPTDYTRLTGSIIDRNGRSKTLSLGRIAFDEDFTSAVFANPKGRTVIGCGTEEPLLYPRREESFLFAVKLPTG